MKRDCQALGCTAQVSRKVFMCPKHWRLVPMVLRSQVTALILTGRDEDTFGLTLERARQEVAKKEGM